MSDLKSLLETEAREYADSIIPNPNRNDAPYCTTGDRWEDINDAFIAGSKALAEYIEQERIKAAIIALKDLDWQVLDAPAMMMIENKIAYHQQQLKSTLK